MSTQTIVARTALALAAASAPLAAQTPLFVDGSAFGGSRVFSEGLNPLSNPARFDQSPSGWYLTYIDGDQRAKDNKAILKDTLSTDAAAVTAALGRLKDSPWAQRVRAYGIAGVKDGMNFGYTREEFHSALAAPDLLNVGSSLAENTTYLDGRRAVVNRLHFGGGTLASGTAAGFNVRVEKWEMGTTTPLLSRNPDVFPAPLGAFPFTYSADDYVMAYPGTRVKTLNVALDVGFTTQIAEGLHVGAMADQLNAKRLWDVDLKPQFRWALQIDLGPNTRFTVESDFNAVERMPFAIKQKTSAASVRYQVSPSVIVLLGGEQKKIGDAAATRFGATLQLRTPTFLLSLGFQAGQDRPLKGLSLMVN